MITYFDVYMTPFKTYRTIHLYLPNNYNQSEERYPVIYMFDGHNLFEDQKATYGKSWGLSQFLDYYDKPFIVVGIECNHKGNERLKEFSPYDFSSPYFGDIKGQGKILMDWLIKELKPLIDTSYRTIPFRECTMIGGSSMGGLMALYGVIHYNSYISKAACLSSAIMFCYQDIVNLIQDATLNPDTKIYLSWGSDESRNKNALAYASAHNLHINHLLALKNIQTYPHMIVKGKHNEQTWEQQIPDFMNYLWKGL